jgi:hypothetical protein
MGGATTASGTYSTAMGGYTTAESYGQTSLGVFNTPITPISTTGFNAEDRLLVVGNGVVGSTSDALVILKNGTITAPSFDISEIIDAKALVTKEFADANYIDASFSGDYNDLTNQPTIVTPTGLETINESNGTGLVKAGRVAANYGNVGENAVDLSQSNSTSTTRGATGFYSTAMGLITTASGAFSTAMGRATTAESYGQTTLGAYNIPTIPNNAFDFDESDQLLVVGNGVNSTNTSNALTILKNGNTTVNGTISAISNSDTAPSLIVSGSANTGAGDNGIISSNPDYAGSDILLRSYDAVIVQLDYDNNELGDFGIVNGAGTTVFNVSEAGNVTINGSQVHASDRRLKKEIEAIPFGLKEILQLEPKAYNWKAKDQEHKSLGLIAQDVQKIITNVVQVGDDELKTMGVSYTELIPVLIKATQEQQVIIDAQAKKIEALEKKEKLYASIEARLSALETANTNEDEVAVATTETTKE